MENIDYHHTVNISYYYDDTKYGHINKYFNMTRVGF